MLKFARVSGAILLSLVCFTAIACSSSASSTTSSNSGGGPGGGGGGRGGGGRGGRGGGDVPVVTGKVVKKDIPVDLGAIGNVEANTTISVRSQISGVLQQVFFNEGDFIKAGDKLAQIDPRPYDAALKQAQANLVRDQALLNQAEAQLKRDGANAEYMQITAERQAQLVSKGIVSKDASEQARAAADTSTGTIESDRANVESAKAQLDAQVAAVDNAKLQLGYTVITSPVSGRTGNLTVRAGNLVNANSTEMFTVSQIEPVFVTFTVPAVNLPSIKKFMAEGSITATATPQDEEASPVEGKLIFVDSAVDTSTDTIKLKATFDNKDRRLWPGQFAKITLRLTTLKDALVVPSQTVQTGQDGQFVFVVKPDFTVEQRTVKTGQRSDADTVITDGLKLGDPVVVEGQLRLETGTKITIADGKDVGGSRGGRGGRGNGGNGNGGRGQNGGGNGGNGGGGQRGQ